MKIRLALAAATALLTISAAGAGHASTYVVGTSGSVWENDPTTGDASTVPSGAPAATFTPGAIDYDSRPSNNTTGYTIGGFFNGATLSNPGIAGDTVDNTFTQITGNLYLNSGSRTFTIQHDDGVVLSIAGLGAVLSAPGPTSPETSTFTVTNPGPAGSYGFTLNYNECCGPPAVLILSSVPEPATWSMMIVGVAGIGGIMRRQARQALAVA